jgi:uncharacterized protein YeaO (DUF488 family)
MSPTYEALLAENKMAKAFRVKRIYEDPDAADGFRVLVDRLWPRGVAKARAHIDLWLKDIAPSDELRHRFHDAPGKWNDFAKAYAKELLAPAAQEAAKLLQHKLREGAVTLLYAARDEEHNNAVALKAWLEAHG